VIQALYPDIYHQLVSSVAPGHWVGYIHSRNVTVECSGIFDSPAIRTAVGAHLWIELRNVICELALNSFEHGKATECVFEIRGRDVIFRDNGHAFDPLGPAPPKSSKRGAGLTYMHQFLKKYGDGLTASSLRVVEQNVTTFAFNMALNDATMSHSCMIHIQDAQRYGRVDRDAVQIPMDCSEYAFTVDSHRFNASNLIDFLRWLVTRIPDTSSVVVHFAPESDLLRENTLIALGLGWLDRGRLRVATT
jgi:hypothetical protein